MADSEGLLIELVKRIPMGKVTSYGDIAQAMGLKTPRQVGWILHRLPEGTNAPCHRVIFSDGHLSGQLSFGGVALQKKWLESEGVVFRGDKVDKKCFVAMRISTSSYALYGPGPNLVFSIDDWEDIFPHPVQPLIF